jgi:hypothetical protein
LSVCCQLPASILLYALFAAAELATILTIQGVLLMLPQMIALIKICQSAKLYRIPLLNTT